MWLVHPSFKIQQLTQQLSQTEKLSRMSSATGADRDALVAELKMSLQRTQQALDSANDQNRILQARTETSLLENQQQHLIQRVCDVLVWHLKRENVNSCQS